ncbi:hypothetical protein [Myxococcus stipitatus]|uniref:hypothetical protein n=1 Tax=Myxococcus stipitatus TaxID=83455 RepID=UPI0030D02106
MGPEDKAPQVSLRGYEEQLWNKDEARFFDTLQDALTRFEFVPPSRDAPPRAAWDAAPPLLGVLETDLAPSVRAMLQGRKGLPREARFMPDRSGTHADWAGGCIAIALIGFVPLGLVAMSFHGEFVQYNPDYLRERALAMLIHPMWTVGLVGLLGVSLFAIVAWNILRSRSVWARILSGAWRRGLYFLPDMLAQVRPGDVSVIPRDRILSLQARPGEIVIRYLSEDGRLALRSMPTGPTTPKWLGVEKLEHWLRSGIIRCPISTRFPVRILRTIRTAPGIPRP